MAQHDPRSNSKPQKGFDNEAALTFKERQALGEERRAASSGVCGVQMDRPNFQANRFLFIIFYLICLGASMLVNCLRPIKWLNAFCLL